MSGVVVIVLVVVYAGGVIATLCAIGPDDLAKVEAEVRWQERLEQFRTGKKPPELPSWVSSRAVSLFTVVLAAVLWPLAFIFGGKGK